MRIAEQQIPKMIPFSYLLIVITATTTIFQPMEQGLFSHRGLGS